MGLQCWANAQYPRHECLELVDVRRSISDSDLEENLLKIFEKVGYPIERNNIEASHRISKKDERKMVKFSLRKDCQNILLCNVFNLDYIFNCQFFINTSQ